MYWYLNFEQKPVHVVSSHLCEWPADLLSTLCLWVKSRWVIVSLFSPSTTSLILSCKRRWSPGETRQSYCHEGQRWLPSCVKSREKSKNVEKYHLTVGTNIYMDINSISLLASSWHTIMFLQYAFSYCVPIQLSCGFHTIWIQLDNSRLYNNNLFFSHRYIFQILITIYSWLIFNMT